MDTNREILNFMQNTIYVQPSRSNPYTLDITSPGYEFPTGIYNTIINVLTLLLYFCKVFSFKVKWPS